MSQLTDRSSLSQGLHNYIIMPFEEQLQYKSNHFQSANEDSSNRQRSSSLVRIHLLLGWQ